MWWEIQLKIKLKHGSVGNSLVLECKGKTMTAAAVDAVAVQVEAGDHFAVYCISLLHCTSISARKWKTTWLIFYGHPIHTVYSPCT